MIKQNSFEIWRRKNILIEQLKTLCKVSMSFAIWMHTVQCTEEPSTGTDKVLYHVIALKYALNLCIFWQKTDFMPPLVNPTLENNIPLVSQLVS